MRRSTPAPNGADAGQAIGLVLVAIVLIALAAIAMSSTAVRMRNRAVAQTAADAAALAGVAGGGRPAAATIAAANGATLVQYVQDGPAEINGIGAAAGGDGVTVRVVVEVHGERAVGAASNSP